MKKDFAKELESVDLTKLIADYAGVNKYSDRDAIIVLTSILEELIERILRKELCISNQKIDDKLFSFNGALGTFSNKITMVYSLGKISKEAYDDLELLRNYRNECAHNISLSEIESKQFNSTIHNFCLLKKSKAKDVEDSEGKATNRFRLVFEVLLLCLILNKVLSTTISCLPPENDYISIDADWDYMMRVFEKERTATNTTAESKDDMPS